jgi:hypothetical protein
MPSILSSGPRRIALKPPIAELMVETKKERLKALVRFASPALSARMAVHEAANMASESPDRIAAENSKGTLVPTSPKRS